jgi:hypothetical protein
MEMRVDAKRIRVEREKRAWSQQHLASVTELGLRTIQRIEATGLASYESIQAISARALHNFLGALGRSGLGRAAGLAAAFFAGTAIVAYADTGSVAMMIPILGAGCIGSLGLASKCAWRNQDRVADA